MWDLQVSQQSCIRMHCNGRILLHSCKLPNDGQLYQHMGGRESVSRKSLGVVAEQQRRSAIMSGLHHHTQPDSSIRQKRKRRQLGTTLWPPKHDHHGPVLMLLCVFLVRRRHPLPSHIQHKYFSQAAETMAETRKLVTSHGALVHGRL